MSRVITGIERERGLLRSSALRIIRAILEQPLKEWPGKEVRRDWLAPPPLASFRHLEPVGWGVSDDDWWVFRPQECTPDIVWPLHVGYVFETSGGNDGPLQIVQAHTIQAKQARGYAKMFSPFMVRMDFGQMVEGKMWRAAAVMAWLAGRWSFADGVAGDEQDRLQPNLATAIALRQRYEWAVSLGLEGSPSVRFATDPTGIKDVFRIRDLPEGRDRRAALMTWVTDHWRQNRNDPEMELYVRKHLRGAVAFGWRGMECEILPSQFDVERRDRLIAERDEMRKSGEDRRPRSA